jgi:hypothetical protein
MNKRTLLNLSLLVIVLVLIGVVVFAPEEELEQAPPLTELKKADIVRIDISRPEQPSILLEKNAEQWEIIEPYNVTANNFKVEALLGLVETPSHAQYPLQDGDKVKFGFDKPVAWVNFNDELTIAFGNSEPISNNRYVLIGDQLHLITDTFYYQLGVKAHTLVDHGLLPRNAKLEELALPDMTLSFVTGAWIVEPKQAHDSTDSAIQLIDEWRNSQAVSVAPLEKTPAQKTITARFRAGPAIRFELRHTDSGIILARPDIGLQYTLSKDAADRLLKLPEPPDTATTTNAPAEPTPQQPAP